MSIRTAAEAAVVLAFCTALAFLPVKEAKPTPAPSPPPIITPTAPIGNEPGVGEFKLQPETCLVCNGTGVSNGLTCYLCKGAGRVNFHSSTPPAPVAAPPAAAGVFYTDCSSGSCGAAHGGPVRFAARRFAERRFRPLQRLFGRRR